MAVIEFADAEDARNIPIGYKFAALYGPDCDHPTAPEQAARWDPPHRRYYTFRGDPVMSMLDFEPGTRDYQSPGLVREWLLGRQAAHRLHKREAWIYSDLSNAEQAAHAAHGLPFRWNIATLDGVKRSRDELSRLLVHWGVPAALALPELIAAQQWFGNGAFDANVCFVDSDW